jgi:heterodisulfide reductase subunit B
MTSRTYLYFPGCKIRRFLPQYGISTRAVMSELDIALEETELNCCGYPVRSEDFHAAMAAGARNLAIAAAKGLPLMTPCKCCYGSLKHTDHWMRQDAGLRRHVNAILADEGLAWTEDIVIHHLLTVLDEVVGCDRLKRFIKKPLSGLPVAAHYGCHALRPGNVTRFDNPLSPTIFERLVALTGASPVAWPQRLECCGHPLWQKNNRFSLALMDAKLADARQAGARVVATACTYCQLQFDNIQHDQAPHNGQLLPAVLYTQLLGMAMGMPDDRLGMTDNRIQWKPSDVV